MKFIEQLFLENKCSYFDMKSSSFIIEEYG